ncbi:MAG: cytochrome d ubiquinol oxidase subunit II [Verrucomicrobiae bacterium]|nr:cytochrome d ubiquinol oxidase subunit II [Verrucomicrobiae bacterium]
MSIDLNSIWFALLAALLAGYAILDGFDLGIGALYPFVRRDEHRQLLLRAIGPVWDGNEVWLVAAGGALFAAFPHAYATVFSGFYPAMILLLLALIMRAVSIELRNMRQTACWRRVWDACFCTGSVLATLILGVAIGNIVRGLPLDPRHEFTGTLGTLLNPYSVFIGLTVLGLFALHGAAYAALKSDGELKQRLKGLGIKVGLAGTLLLAAALLITWATLPHVTARLKAAPWILGLPVLSVVCAGIAVRKLSRDATRCAFCWTAAAILATMAQVAGALYPNLVPAVPDAANSLTIYNAASSQRTLKIMLIIAAVGLPLVFTYTIILYRTFKGKVALAGPGY